MDLDNLHQNMNTRVVFKEPRGMIRWLQLFFAIVAFATVVDFSTFVGIKITCPPPPAPAPAPTPNSTTPAPPTPATNLTLRLNVSYPFDFSHQPVTNTCPQHSNTYNHQVSLSGSPQFFVMTGVLSLMFASGSLVVYLLFSSTYESVPVWPVADLIVTGILCLFWFIASSSFSSGVAQLKATVKYSQLEQTLCTESFKNSSGICIQDEPDYPSWKGLNVGLLSGFTSFFLWGCGMWFVYKETHFHTPRNTFGPA